MGHAAFVETLKSCVCSPSSRPEGRRYFAVGIIYGGLPSTIYGFFLGYLNVEGYVYATAATIVSLPWSFKFLFGAINDCVPIYGFRRKPYMVVGWTLCAAALLRLAIMPLPEPYWCINSSDSGYVKTKHVNGKTVTADACNPSAAEQGGKYAFLMMLASLGYCVADVAADGLTVSLARAEPPENRGKTQTTVYLVRTLGNVVAVTVVGICMNSWEYNGSFTWGLSYSSIMGLFSVPALVMARFAGVLGRGATDPRFVARVASHIASHIGGRSRSERTRNDEGASVPE